MKSLLPIYIFSLILLISAHFINSVVFKLRFLHTSQRFLKEWSTHLQKPTYLIKEARERVSLYEKRSKSVHMRNGMIGNHNLFRLTGLCDSLLFSSLRFVALHKMGMSKDADEAWKYIRQSRKEDGTWLRHPSCHEDLSKDMLMGVLSALTQRPKEWNLLLRDLAKHLNSHSGYFDDGPLYLSFATPSVKESIDDLLKLMDLPPTEFMTLDIPTLEFEVFYIPKGFESHLLGLHVWLNGEIRNLYAEKGLRYDYHPLRGPWIASWLYATNPKNLFFKWLFLNELGLMNKQVRLHLLEELLEMPEFPKDRLPWNCDRKADYLWQRSDKEHRPLANCSVEFNGADFLWMTGLLLDGLDEAR